MTRMANEHERADHDRDLRKHAILTIPDINTRFTRPIVCPTTGEHVSAETLYNRCCAALGHTVRDHIGDLILDNLSYSGQPMGEVDTDEMCKAIYAWAKSVREQISRNPTVAEPLRSIINSSSAGVA